MLDLKCIFQEALTNIITLRVIWVLSEKYDVWNAICSSLTMILFEMRPDTSRKRVTFVLGVGMGQQERSFYYYSQIYFKYSKTCLNGPPIYRNLDKRKINFTTELFPM